jgi:hypothetical protein
MMLENNFFGFALFLLFATRQHFKQSLLATPILNLCERVPVVLAKLYLELIRPFQNGLLYDVAVPEEAGDTPQHLCLRLPKVLAVPEHELRELYGIPGRSQLNLLRAEGRGCLVQLRVEVGRGVDADGRAGARAAVQPEVNPEEPQYLRASFGLQPSNVPRFYAFTIFP